MPTIYQAEFQRRVFLFYFNTKPVEHFGKCLTLITINKFIRFEVNIFDQNLKAIFFALTIALGLECWNISIKFMSL